MLQVQQEMFPAQVAFPFTVVDRKKLEAKEQNRIKTTTGASDKTFDLVEPTARIDDPVRMYLQQMGEIPLLSRPEEISLAKFLL